MDSHQDDEHSKTKTLNRWQRKLLKVVAVGDGLSDSELLKAGVATAVLAPTLRLIDWILEGIVIGLFALMKHQDFAESSIWIVLWALNMTLSSLVIMFNDRAKIDLTLMQTKRKIINAFIKKKKAFGYFLELVMAGRLLLWDGPDYLIIFFRDRLNSGKILFVIFLIASGIQMFIWTKIYSYGYSGIADIFRLPVTH